MEPNAPRCDRTITPEEAHELRAIVAALPDGATLCFAPGRYPARLLLARSIGLRGLGDGPGAVILDGEHKGPVLHASGDGLRLAVTNLSIVGGSGGPSAPGGGLVVGGSGEVTVSNVVFSGNQSDGPGAQALWASDARVSVDRCRIVGNRGRGGGAIVVQRGPLAIRDSLLEGNAGPNPVVRAANATVERSTIVAASGAPALLLASGSISDSIVVAPSGALAGDAPGKISIARSVLAGAASGFADRGGNRVVDPAAPIFAGSGSEPFAPAPASPAIGLSSPPAGVLDLAGRPRRAGGAAGALEAP